MKGRPTLLDNEMQSQIVAAIQRGAYIETAAALAGIHKSTFYDWLKIGRETLKACAEAHEDQQPAITPHQAACANLADAIEKAMAQSEVRDIKAIDDAAQAGQWQAAAWKLERKHHQRWGRKVALTDEKGGNFFDGMARAWAEALEQDADTDDYIPGEVERPLIEKKTNGDGRE